MKQFWQKRAVFCCFAAFSLMACCLNAQQSDKLEIGDEAPEISGSDFRDEMLALKDQRGKIVMLYFWGEWCPPCRAMNPHCYALAKHLPEDSFVLIGVNSDKNHEVVKKLIEAGTVNWRSFADRDGDRQISRDWAVQGWPAIILIDQAGMVQFINPQRGKGGMKALTGAIAEMLDESTLQSDLQGMFEAVESTAAEERQKPGPGNSKRKSK